MARRAGTVPFSFSQPASKRSRSVQLPPFAELDAVSQRNRSHAATPPTMGRPSAGDWTWGHGWRDYRHRGFIPIIAVQLGFDTAAFDVCHWSDVQGKSEVPGYVDGLQMYEPVKRCGLPRSLRDVFGQVFGGLIQAEIYRVLQKAQCSAVPVFLGTIDLKLFLYLHGAGDIRHMLLMGWAGESIDNVKDKEVLSREISRSKKEIRMLGVVHKDLRLANMLWNDELRRVLIIDFHRLMKGGLDP
ncbi:hypothetical protein ACJ73_04466 [Blastomyces percursus]|uniref:Protein kinase domain-containing protein n=1 Tax=Blastomyces percursus TaxID=1658174 RepID=A0A1J9R852_9EURO|nr:hypothetical protein ACJ73_04466 [Blastomyces percursus]